MVLATFDNSVDETVITLGTQFVPFHINPYPRPGASVTVSTSANALILAAVKFAYDLVLVKYKFEPSAKLAVVKLLNVDTVFATFAVVATVDGNIHCRVPSTFAVNI